MPVGGTVGRAGWAAGGRRPDPGVAASVVAACVVAPDAAAPDAANVQAP